MDIVKFIVASALMSWFLYHIVNKFDCRYIIDRIIINSRDLDSETSHKKFEKYETVYNNFCTNKKIDRENGAYYVSGVALTGYFVILTNRIMNQYEFIENRYLLLLLLLAGFLLIYTIVYLIYKKTPFYIKPLDDKKKEPYPLDDIKLWLKPAEESDVNNGIITIYDAQAYYKMLDAIEYFKDYNRKYIGDIMSAFSMITICILTYFMF